MSTAWWIASAGTLLVYSLVSYAFYLRRPDVLWPHRTVAPFFDTFIVTLAIVALAEPDVPIWIGYLLIIMSLSAVQSTRYMLVFSVWVIAVFWCGLIAMSAASRADIPWQLSTVVSIFFVFTALNCDTIATSNRKLRGLVLQASLTDPLTGLANRRRFREILDSHHQPDDRPLAVLMFDLDNFKELNEEYGHVHADTVLVRVCDELRASFRDADTVARYGGDELVVLAHVERLDEAIALGERSLAVVREQVSVSMSVGVAVYPLTATTLDEAVRDADDALGRAKRSGKGRVVAAALRAA
jgi:diguanylate cyclase (GGDEF)-like protein